MAQEVTLGGDRLGAGQKMKTELHNYGMNSFNLEQDWKSTMAPGILYPCLKVLGTTHGSLDIDVDSMIKTLPTRGPLFGSYKLQVDLFSVPFRLYQGILHNNAVEIGMNMSQVKLPKMIYVAIDGQNAPMAIGSDKYTRQINPTSLEKYLGLSGYGTWAPGGASPRTGRITRKLQCVPELAYYDIFKNYYANKQEENAYVITPDFNNIEQLNVIQRVIWGAPYDYEGTILADYNPYNGETIQPNKEGWGRFITIFIKTDDDKTIEQYLSMIQLESTNNVSLQELEENNDISINISKIPVEAKYDYQLEIAITNYSDLYERLTEETYSEGDKISFTIASTIESSNYYASGIKLTPFALKNIDRMRQALLKCNEENEEFEIISDDGETNKWGKDSGEDGTGLPYLACVATTDEGLPWNAFTQNGLVVKTYQSDLFNNWLQTEYVDMITSMTTIDTTNGFSIDTLNLAEKIYNLLNRILVAGGTYQDWQEAVYGEGVMRMCETPMYVGGMSAEVLFEEVISTSETKVDGDKQALGSLGGKGKQIGRKGGENIHVKFEEPGYVIGIASLTPRICVSQGNDWDRTEISTLDDLHKPELDGIGFQNAMTEQLGWWTTLINGLQQVRKQSHGKQTAWINYQTAMDKCYGDFARMGGSAFMVLNRNYEMDGGTIADLTTYIDPAKYNYAFAYDRLDAQNFWAQIHFNITARWKMGAQQLPNL